MPSTSSGNKPSCPDCGAVPTNHFLDWNSAFLELIISPLARLGEGAVWLFQPFFAFCQRSGITEKFIRTMTALGIFKIVTAPDKRNGTRATCLWNEAIRRGIRMYDVRPFGRPVEWFFAHWKNSMRSFDGLPRPLGRASKALLWMDNKGKMREHFSRAGIPVARGGSVFTWKRAVALFHDIKNAVIIKPGEGSRSRHTFIHITNEKDLARAYRSAKRLCPWVIVEEELRGMVYRVTLIGGQCIAVMRREPPHVVGDGRSSIKKLVEKENERPGRHGPVFHEIACDVEAESELARQHLTWESVPSPNHVVILGLKVGRGSGGSTTDVTDLVHPENKKLFEKIAEVLGDPLVGVDFMIEDMARPWTEQQPCGVIECNGCPFIDLHHEPLVGEPRNAAGALWDIIFPGCGDSRTTQSPSQV